MIRIALEEVDRVYACSGSWELRRHLVWHPEFRRFCLELTRLVKALGELSEEDYWSSIVRPLKRYRFDLTAAPLPLDYAGEESSKLAARLLEHLSQCAHLYPTLAEPASKLVERFSTVSKLEENPYLKVCEDVLARSTANDCAILIKDPHLIPRVQAVLGASELLKHAVVLAPTQLREDSCYKTLVVVGPVSWYPTYVLGAPRAKEVHALQYGWIVDPWKPASVFLGSGEGETKRREREHVLVADDANKPALAKDPEDLIAAQEVLPKINWDRLNREHSRSLPGEHGQEEVEARMFLLEGGGGVFLDTEEGTSALVIDLEGEEGDRVRRIPVPNVEAGMFLLLRTGGGGDLIVPLADRILGSEAIRAREMQSTWKSRLIERCSRLGVERSAQQLRALGAERANGSNLRRWMSYRSIRTHDRSDFLAIMNFVGLSALASDYWNMMELIASAHTRAGFHIRDLLLKKVIEGDLAKLKKAGRLDIVLSEADSGSMAVIRVTDISPKVSTIPAGRLNHLFEIQESLWRG